MSTITITRASQDYGAASEQDKTQKYTCTMHPEVVMDHPAIAPKCGMKLVPLKKDKRPKDPTPTNRETAATRCTRPHKRAMRMQMEMSITPPSTLPNRWAARGPGRVGSQIRARCTARMFMFDDNMLMLHGAIFPALHQREHATRR